MEFHGPNEVVECMNRCDIESTSRNCKVLEKGHTLVLIFDCNMTAPVQAVIPMVEVMEFEGEKVKRVELIFDSVFFRFVVAYSA